MSLNPSPLNQMEDRVFGEKSRKSGAIRYPAPARKSTRLYPPMNAINNAKTELMTEEKALMAHAHGIHFFPACARSRIPEGKGNPMRKPMGKMARKVKKILYPKEIPKRFSWTAGKIKKEMKMNMLQRTKHHRRLLMIFVPIIFFERKLPIPEEKRSENRMTLNE
jgi:hypothetical protein